MRRLAFTAGVGVVLGGMLGSAPAMAGLNRTYVSTAGDDANPCTAASPCRTFQVAHDNTNAGGEIMVLAPGGYGLLNVTKSISINNDGVGEVGFLAGGITINAGTSDVVNLAGLTLTGVGAANYGIELISGGTLNIKNCVVRGYNGAGIYAHPGGSTTFSVNVAETTVANNTAYGIQISPGGIVATTATIERVQVSGSQTGVFVVAPGSSLGVNATVADSAANNNRDYGIRISSAGGPGTLMVVNSQAVNNGTGVASEGAAATMLLSGNTVTGNTAAAFFSGMGGVINSFGNNSIKGNPGGDGGAITLVATK